MSVDELIQLMRTCNIDKVRMALEYVKKEKPDNLTWAHVVRFYSIASTMKEPKARKRR